MSATLLAFGLGALSLALLLLPLWPSLREASSRRDARPLRIPTESRVDTRWFAQRCAAFVREHLSQPLAACAAQRSVLEGWLPNGEPYVVFPVGERFLPSAHELARGRCARLVAANGSLSLPGRLRFDRDVYAADSLHGEAGIVLRAAYAERDLRLGPGATTVRWAHAGEHLHVGEGSVLHGRASSGGSITVHGPCTFERMRAERIELGERALEDVWRDRGGERHPRAPRTLPNFRESSGNRALIEGDALIPERSLITCDLVAWGDVRVGRDSIIRGSIKSHRSILLQEGCRVDGSLVAHEHVELKTGCRVSGPILAEGALRTAPRCLLGEALRPATVRAASMTLRLGSTIHGVIWATSGGRVIP